MSNNGKKEMNEGVFGALVKKLNEDADTFIAKVDAESLIFSNSSKTSFYAKIGTKLEELSKLYNLKNHQISELTGLSPSQISKIKKGRMKEIPFNTLLKLCKIFPVLAKFLLSEIPEDLQKYACHGEIINEKAQKPAVKLFQSKQFVSIPSYLFSQLKIIVFELTTNASAIPKHFNRSLLIFSDFSPSSDSETNIQEQFELLLSDDNKLNNIATDAVGLFLIPNTQALYYGVLNSNLKQIISPDGYILHTLKNEKFVFFPLIYTVSPFQRFRWQRISRMRDENLRNELNSIELDHALIQGLNPDSNLDDDRYKEFTKRLMYEQSVPLTENLRVSNEKVKPDSYSVSEAYEKIDSIRNKEKKQLDDYLYEDILNDKFTPKKYG